MVIKLLPDQVPLYWNHIKFAAVTVNILPAEKRIQEYCLNLLCSLLAGKSQAWFVLDTTRNIKVILITCIREDLGKIGHLWIDTAYGYRATTGEEKEELVTAMKKFAKNVGCETLTAFTSSDVAGRAVERMGLKKIYDLYSVQVGG